MREMEDDTGVVAMEELKESMNDFDVKLDYESLKILENYLDLEMNNKFVRWFCFSICFFCGSFKCLTLLFFLS